MRILFTEYFHYFHYFYFNDCHIWSGNDSVTKQVEQLNVLIYTVNISAPHCRGENLMNVLGWDGSWVEAVEDEALKCGRVRLQDCVDA